MSLPKIPPLRSFYRRIPARVAALNLFRRLYANQANAFLYESLEAHGGVGRYSFMGAAPRAIFRAKNDALELTHNGDTWRTTGNALHVLRDLLTTMEDVPPVAPFCGGAVGYLGYDCVRLCERLPDNNPDDLGLPDAYFLFPREVIGFDHLEQVVHVLLYQDEGHAERFGEIRAAVQACEQAPDSAAIDPALAANLPDGPPLESNMPQAAFEEMVRRGKEYIAAGDIFQVVLSQRFEFAVPTSPLRLYEALRVTNPSPYMYYLALDGFQVLGSSPEILARLTGRRAITRPLAGTRPRGKTPEQDAALAAELLADEKERAEHVMLVDLGRNDLGRVSEFGSVKLADVLRVERHSKVMHLVSNVEGWLAEGRDAVDVFRAVFPAGTVSGAPKVRAMEIIDELEPVRRGIYAGAIGYFSLLGDMDLCIAIRTMVIRGDRGYIQAGAGIVADSVPEREYQETVNKARALMRAVELARRL